MRYSSAMLRRGISREPAPPEPWRIRGASPGRLENFSDCTFTFAVTLLIFALEVPKTFPELLKIMPGFFSFAACFAILCTLWYRHVQFFQRYGLTDRATVSLNAAFLTLVLFFLYPLKFLMNTVFGVLGYSLVRLFAAATHTPKPPRPMLMRSAPLMPRVLAIYLVGFAAVSVVYALLYRHALAKRRELELSPFEEAGTRDDAQLWAFSAFLGSLTANLALVLPDQWVPMSNLLVLGVPLMRRYQQRRRRMRVAAMSGEATASNPPGHG